MSRNGVIGITFNSRPNNEKSNFYTLRILYFEAISVYFATMKNCLVHTIDMDDVELVSIIDELPLWSAPFGLKLLETIRIRLHINMLDIEFTINISNIMI